MHLIDWRRWLRRTMLATAALPLLAAVAGAQQRSPAFDNMVPAGEDALQQLTDHIFSRGSPAAAEFAPPQANPSAGIGVPEGRRPLGPLVGTPEASRPAAPPTGVSDVRRLPPVSEGPPPPKVTMAPARASRFRSTSPFGDPAIAGADAPLRPYPVTSAQPPARAKGNESRSNIQLTSGVEGAGTVVSAAAQEPIAEPDQSAEKAIEPIPEPGEGTADIEAASFNGITPGASTFRELRKTWGEPKKTGQQDGADLHLYSVPPFDFVEVQVLEEKVTSIVIRLSQPYPAATVAEQLELGALRPVLVSNAMGEILGQSYPERGVLFGFLPGDPPTKASLRVNQIVLEPVSAEPFVLRAETYLESRPDWAAADLEAAVKLDSGNPRAFWLQARGLTAIGRHVKALHAATKAVELEPANPQFRVLYAQLLGETGKFAQAQEEAQKTVDTSERRPHIRARALCLLGDLMASSPQPDYRKAMNYHTEAMKLADSLVNSPHPAIRVSAKEVLLDAHLGAAHDIAWGVWNQKDTAVDRWLGRAADLADDLVKREGVSPERRLRVGARGLASCVALQGRLDPTRWAEITASAAEGMLAGLPSGPMKGHVRWQLGMAMYDALQVFQIRGEHDKALKYGELAIEQMEQRDSAEPSDTADSYLIGRLYFRLGAIHAVGKRNHAEAVAWFDKAVPVLDKVANNLGAADAVRLGESYVSMGISYWENGDRQKGVELTEQGVERIERVVQRGGAEPTVLEVPYNNLATMRRQLGQVDEAEALLEKAGHLKSSIIR